MAGTIDHYHSWQVEFQTAKQVFPPHGSDKAECASTSYPPHVSRLIAPGWQAGFSLTIDLYVGSDGALTAAAAVQMKELISLSDKLTDSF